jgi:hypothetical protein
MIGMQCSSTDTNGQSSSKSGGEAQSRAQQENGDGQHEMQWTGGGLAVRAARFRAAVEPQMRAVGEAGRRDWACGLYLRMPCGRGQPSRCREMQFHDVEFWTW